MDIDKLFQSVADKLQIDFDEVSSQIGHRLSKGQVRERELVHEFLLRYLPRDIGIGHGEVAASTGEVSRECDIVFFESRGCPTFIDKAGYQVFPVECVYGITEVKSMLDTAALDDAFTKVTTLKRLPKTAFAPQAGAIVDHTVLYDRKWTFFPSLGFVFAYDSIALETLSARLRELQADIPPHERVDSVWVLKKGMIVNWSDERRVILPTPSNTTRARAVRAANPLLLMVVHLQQLLQSAWMPRFVIERYMQHVKFGDFIDS
jgi:hypothetical protein